MIKEKITFIISSIETVAESYAVDYLILPDYLPINKEQKPLQKATYDFVLVGTISACKDVEDVLSAVYNSNLTVKIAGFFEDTKLYETLIEKYKECKQITIENKYLTENEYYDLIQSGRFVVLAYKLGSYQDRSSGVVLDAIYCGRPVIGSNIEAFKIIEKHEMGFIYDFTISEIINKVESCNYATLLSNVDGYRKSLKNSMDLLLTKIDTHK